MAFKIISGSAILFAGIASVFLGILFIIAGSGMNSRLAASVIFFLVSAPLFIYGLRNIRSAMMLNPGQIKKKILAAAAGNNGEISEETINAVTGWNDTVLTVITILINNRTAESEERNGKTFYIFPEYQFRYVQNKCPFCGNDYPVRDDIRKCPSCGGDLKLSVQKSSSGREKFSMDS